MHDQKPVVATYKIFVFAGFVCAALITSLFVYRISHKNNAAIVNNEDSMVMTAGRDINSVDLIRADSKPFTNRDLLSHWTLMFFGFTHCNSVCPVTLSMMSKSYPILRKDIPNLQVVFVSLDPERDTKAGLKKYTQNYHADFIGVSGKIESVRKLQSQLGIYSAREDNTANNSNYQLQHTSSILLISPEGKWVGMFRFGMQPKQFEQAVLSAITTISKTMA